MKMVSITVPVRDEDTIRTQLRTEPGIYLFREKEHWSHMYALGRQVTHIQFILRIMDEEVLTILKLKYPYDFEMLDV